MVGWGGGSADEDRRRAVSTPHSPGCRRQVIALIGALAFALGLSLSTSVDAAAQEVTQAQLKAGYLYNFLLLAEWPERRGTTSETVVCVVGEDPVREALLPVMNQPLDGLPMRVQAFSAKVAPEALKACRLVYFSSTLNDAAARIASALHGSPILTVGETPRFIDEGGMVGLVLRGTRVRFEINSRAAAAAGIKFRAKVLRLAERVVEH